MTRIAGSSTWARNAATCYEVNDMLPAEMHSLEEIDDLLSTLAAAHK
jgi:hypothetical protein